MKHNQYDEMELGDSGWIATADGYRNIYNNHTIDHAGREFDENGVLVFDPETQEGQK